MNQQNVNGAEYDFYGKLPLKKAIPLGLQHVLAMFVGNLTPILIITGACGLGAVVCHWPRGRQGTHHHGNQFWLYRSVQQCGRSDGRRCRGLWRDHVRFDYRWNL